MKSTMLMNWIAPTRKMIRRSEGGTAAPVARTSVFMTSGFPLALAQGAEVLERRAAQERIAARLVTDRRRRRLAVVVARVDPGLLRQPHQPLQALPHLGRV